MQPTNGISYVSVVILGRNYKFLADSGASISLINATCLPSHVPIDTKARLRLSGVNRIIANRGCAMVDMIIGGMKVKQRMCVIDNISCAVDGILGVDFLHKMKALIDFS